MIDIQNLSRVYGQGDSATTALRDIHLRIPEGAFATIVGTSGSGKTTLLNILGGLDSAYRGEARVDGRELRALSDRERSAYRNQMVGFVFQHFALLEHLDAVQNVALPAFFAKTREPDPLRRAAEVLSRVGLGERLHSYPGQLSGGQKQRVAIARALFGRPRLILADEPTGNLDTSTGAQIISLFEKLNREDKITVVVVTHEDFLFKNVTHKVRLEDGRLVEETPC